MKQAIWMTSFPFGRNLHSDKNANFQDFLEMKTVLPSDEPMYARFGQKWYLILYGQLTLWDETVWDCMKNCACDKCDV